jgi:hypothetical protein
MKGEEVPPVFEVFEENWTVVGFFLRLITQWNYSQGVRLGLNYQSIEFLFRSEGLDSKEWSDMMDGIQIMEMESLQIFRDKEKK